MNSHLVVVLALCAYVQSAVPPQDEIGGGSITSHIDVQQLRLKAGSQDISEDDRLLSSKLDVQGRNLIADRIQALLESFRPVIINGNDVLAPLDPLYVPHIGPFTHSSTGVLITTNLHNFNMKGLQWYAVDQVTFSSLRLALGVHMTLPHLTVTGSYDAFARIALLSHSAGGNFRMFINRIETGVDLRLGINLLGGGHLTLRELDINFVIHDVTIQIEGMVGSTVLNSLINTLLQNAAQTLVTDHLERVTRALSELLFEVINDFLRNFTLDDLLGN